jgi:hypothetical protein
LKGKIDSDFIPGLEITYIYSSRRIIKSEDGFQKTKESLYYDVVQKFGHGPENSQVKMSKYLCFYN